MRDWRKRVHEVIAEADSPAGKRFDVVLLWLILFSVLAVILDSVDAIHRAYRHGPTPRSVATAPPPITPMTRDSAGIAGLPWTNDSGHQRGAPLLTGQDQPVRILWHWVLIVSGR